MIFDNQAKENMYENFRKKKLKSQLLTYDEN